MSNPIPSRDALRAYAPMLRTDRYRVEVAQRTLAGLEATRDAAESQHGKPLAAARRVGDDNARLYQARIDRMEAYVVEAGHKLEHARNPGLAKAQEVEAEASRVGGIVDTLRNRASETEGRVQWLRGDIGTQEARIDQYERIKAEAEATISRLEWQVSPAKISSQEYRVRNAQSEYDDWDSRVSRAQSELSSAETAVSSYESDIRSLEGGDDPDKESKISSLRSRLSGARSDVSDAESKVRHARSERDDAEYALRRERQELERLQELMRQLEAARDRRVDAIRNIEDAHTEIAAHRREIPELEASVPGMRREASQRAGDRDRLAGQARALRGQKNGEDHPQVVEARKWLADQQRELDLARQAYDRETTGPRQAVEAAQRAHDAAMGPSKAAVADAVRALADARARLDGHVGEMKATLAGGSMWRRLGQWLSGFRATHFVKTQAAGPGPRAMTEIKPGIGVEGLADELLTRYDHDRGGTLGRTRPAGAWERLQRPDEGLRRTDPAPAVGAAGRTNLKGETFAIRALLEQADRDRDGAVTRDELVRTIAAYDQDGDGKLSARGFWQKLAFRPKGELERFEQELGERRGKGDGTPG